MLAAFNTALIVISGVALVTGRILIAKGNRRGHMWSMLTATFFAALFLVVYVIRWAAFGSTPYPGTGWLRVGYFALLIAHSILAVAVIPFAWGALRYARREDFEGHKRRARVAFPMWLIVALSGWLIYWMLYHGPAG